MVSARRRAHAPPQLTGVGAGAAAVVTNAEAFGT